MKRSLLQELKEQIFEKNQDQFGGQQKFQVPDHNLSKKIEKSQFSTSFQRKQRFLKLICAAFLLSGFIYYRFIFSLNSRNCCIFDAYQQYTFDVNRKLFQGWDNLAIGIGQVIMDGWILISALFWLFKIKTFRFPFAVLIFFIVRYLLFLNTQKFPFPQFMVWHSPGFFSLTVPYDHTRDFFYSGHTGSLTLILLEFSQFTVIKSKQIVGYIWILTFVCLIYMMNMLIITRVHYTIDIAGGLIFSIYSYWFISKYTIFFDKLVTLPYKYIVIPLQERFRKRKGQDKKQNQQLNQQLINETKNEILKNQLS